MSVMMCKVLVVVKADLTACLLPNLRGATFPRRELKGFTEKFLGSRQCKRTRTIYAWAEV